MRSRDWCGGLQDKEQSTLKCQSGKEGSVKHVVNVAMTKALPQIQEVCGTNGIVQDIEL